MTLPVSTSKTNDTASFDDHPNHHNDLATAVNEDLLRAALSPTSPARALDTPFQPSATRPTFVSYTVQVRADISVAGAETGTVELRSDAANPPTAVRASGQSGLSGTVVAGVSITSTDHHQLAYLAPAGHFVSLVTSGNATITLVHVVEMAL